MTKKELFEGAGKYWVRTKSDEIGCVMNNGIVFSEGMIHKDFYSNDLKVDYHNHEDIFQILIPKQDNTDCCEIEHFNVLETIKKLTLITSLDQLEEVRKEMCEKYNTSFYITNKDGKYEIKFNGELQEIGMVKHNHEEDYLEYPYICDGIKVNKDCNLRMNDVIYYDWNNAGSFTTNPFKSIDLEKEGYELKLGGDE